MNNQAKLSASWALRLLPLLFFFSGASSLIFETIFTRLLTYTFGNTAHAVSTVLAAFLGGLALGAFLIGRWVDLQAPSLRTYGILELLVGVYCLFIPQFFNLLTKAYVSLCHWLDLGPAALTALRFGLAAMVILVPTTLMGGTLPVLARYLAAQCRDFELEVSRLYACNTLGAALGTLASTYLLMPSLGVRATIWIACAVNFTIFLATASIGSLSPPTITEPELLPAESDAALSTLRAAPLLLLAAAFLTGAMALAYEVIWTHVLAFLIGSTVYAFGIMLFTFLLGLGWGARMVADHCRQAEWWGRLLALSQFFLGLAIFLSLPLWSRVPDLFSYGIERALQLDTLGIALLIVLRMAVVAWRIYRRGLGRGVRWGGLGELVVEGLLLAGLITANPGWVWRHESSYFVIGELLRFLTSFYLLIIPALLLGLSFPLLLNLAGHAAKQIGKRVGGVYAANTAGAILGSILTGFIFLPRFGSFTTLRAAALLNLGLGLGFAFAWVRLSLLRRAALAIAAGSLGLIFWTGAREWDARRLSRGSYVYFNPGWPIDRVLYMKEDVQGGLTSVVEVGPARILLSNAKFQGNNTGEVREQIRLALDPILFTWNFDRALVIGLGTGNTLRAVARFPFRQIDAVEIAPHIVEAARLWFEEVNARVFDRDPRVRLTLADGRNFLLLSPHRYDLMTIEISSIWIGGEADLYNKEFYQLCRKRLTDRGVLQQWVQIHHMRIQDLLVILNTAAQVFPHAAFFLGPEQGVLIASASPLECDYRRIEAFDADAGVRQELASLGVPSLSSLLSELMLYDDSLGQALSLLPRFSGLPREFASTDFQPYLEYQTPKGNLLPYDTVAVNLRFLRHFRPPPLPPVFPIRNLPSENEKNLIYGFIAEAAGDTANATEYLRKVDGPASARAQAEIARIEGAAHPEAR